MLYSLYETQKRTLKPVADTLRFMSQSMEQAEILFPFNPVFNIVKAQTDWFSEFTKTYPKPSFNIKTINVKGKLYDIKEEILQKNTFCELIHFKKVGLEQKQKPLLVVAPLSGHFATLLRDTVKTSLQDFDVYVTDWLDPAHIPLDLGEFGFEDYVEYVIDYNNLLREIHGEKINVLAVCQPTVPVLTATAYLEKNHPEQSPNSVIVMGGPIDTRKAPTEVNKYAMKHDINWFKSNVVCTVPMYFKGAGRQVYPGFLQYLGFVSMNLKKHAEAHVEFFNHLLIGADLDIKKHKNFYDEYNAVMDLPGKYYIETLERVFMDQHLAKGTMMYRGESVSLSDIKNVKILAVEGENDDISGREQTFAVLDLTTNLSDKFKKKYLAEGVGHYGVFSGRRWREKIYPQIVDFVVVEENKKQSQVKELVKVPDAPEVSEEKEVLRNALVKMDKDTSVKSDAIKVESLENFTAIVNEDVAPGANAVKKPPAKKATPKKSTDTKKVKPSSATDKK